MLRIVPYFILLIMMASGPAAAQPVERPAHAAPVPVPAGAIDLRIAGSGGDRLAATLYLPRRSGRSAVLIVAPGAGTPSRNREGWQVVARRLREADVGLLVFDPRGTGDTPGTWQEGAPLAQTAEDIARIAGFLAAHRRVLPERIGVIGWSRGGWTAPMAAAASPHIRFMIAVSAPSVSPNEANIHQRSEELLDSGYSAEEVGEITAFRRTVWRYYGTGEGYEAARNLWQQMRQRPWFSRLGLRPDIQPPEALGQPGFAYYREGVYDPAAVLNGLNKPLLVLLGSGDRHIPIDASMAAWRSAFQRSGNPDASLVLLARAGHAMRLLDGPEPMSAVTGHASLMAMPEHPYYWATIIAWLRQHPGDARDAGTTRQARGHS